MATTSKLLAPRHIRLGRTWRHPDLLKVRAGRTLSMFGSQIATVALPLVAVVTRGASPAEMATLCSRH